MSVNPNIKKALFSITIVVLFFGILEMACRAFVFPGSYDYIERRIIEHRLFQRKKVNEFRIFLYGESTMHGGALYPRSVIGKWLRMYLSDLLPEDVMRRVTIINFGRMGVNSGFIATAFAETAGYKPDLAVFYIVHNDFCIVEHRLALVSKEPLGKKFRNFCETLPKKSSFLNLINRLVIRVKIERNKIRDERLGRTDPWYTESDTPEAFTYDANLLRPASPEFKLVAENFENNVRKIIKTARRRAIPVIFFEGLSRWKDYEPVRSVHDTALTKDKLLSWERSFAKAEKLFLAGKYDDALAPYHECITIDPYYALTYYRTAECYEHIREYKKANEYYVLANDSDHFPIRAPSLVNRFYEKIRGSCLKGVDVIQTQKLIEDHSTNGIVDEGLTMDQIHPSPEGQALMALEIVKVIYNNGMLTSRDRWRWDRLRGVDALKATMGLSAENMFYIYIATASYLTKQYNQASEFLEEAMKIKPKSVFVRSWLAWTYQKMGQKEKAIILYRGLYKERPSLAAIFFKKHPEIEKSIK